MVQIVNIAIPEDVNSKAKFISGRTPDKFAKNLYRRIICEYVEKEFTKLSKSGIVADVVEEEPVVVVPETSVQS